MKGYKYEIGDIVQVNEFAANGMPTYLGKYGKIKDFITHGSFDYEVEFDKFSVGKFKELELDIVKEFKFNVGDYVKSFSSDKWHGKIGMVTKAYHCEDASSYDVFIDGKLYPFGENELELSEIKEESLSVKETVKLTNTLIDTFLSQYKNSDDTYTLPKIVLEKLVDSAFEEAE